MTLQKYELLKDDTKQHQGKTLYRIRALIAIGPLVAVGELGGYIEEDRNLSHYENAWVYGNAKVSGNARVSGNAEVENRTHWLLVGPAKSSGRFTTAFKDSKIGVRIVCGCFTGSVKEFSDQIEKTHKDNKEHLEQYRLFCQLIAFNFGVQS